MAATGGRWLPAPDPDARLRAVLARARRSRRVLDAVRAVRRRVTRLEERVAVWHAIRARDARDALDLQRAGQW